MVTMPVSKMHEDEVETDVNLVRRLLESQFPQWANLPVVPVASTGTDNAMYRLGDDKVVRMPRIYWAVEGLEREYQWLPWLAPFLPYSIPVPLGKGLPAEGYPWHWSVNCWLEGENPVVDYIAKPRTLALDLAKFIGTLQQIDPTGGPTTGRSLLERDGEVRTAIEALHGMVDTVVVAKVWDEALKIPERSGPPVWVHGDLGPGNLLLVDGYLQAVIDFSSVGVGDPSSDLRVAWNLLPREVRKDFRTALKVDDEAWERGRGIALAQALVQLPYYYKTNPVLAANARHVISEVLDDYKSGV